MRSLLDGDLERVWLLPGGETRRQLLARAAGVAARLGRPAGAMRIVLSCRETRHFVPGLLGAWLAGATVELLPNTQPGTLDRADADEGARFVLHDLAALRERSPKGIFLPDLPAAAPASLDAAGAAVRMTTSGTTGRPALVEKSAAQLLAEVAVLAELFAPARAVLSTVPPSHIYGLLFGVLLPLRHGSAVVGHDALLPADLARVIAAEGVDRLISTPAHLRAMAAAEMPRGLAVVSSGARLPPELHLELAARHGWRVTDVLGSTETGGVATRGGPFEAWTPLPGAAVGVTAEGELTVRSAWCDGGAAVLGDRVALVPGGGFRHLGRSGDVVKVAGKRADAAALEAAVRALPGVADAAVLLHAAAGHEPRVALAVVGSVSRADVVAAITRDFDAVFAPRLIRFVAAIPRSERGKVALEELRALLDLAAQPALREPPLERVAAGRWRAEVPAALAFFAGHFDGFPILPGVALVERFVWPAVRREHPDAVRVRAARRLRFRRPILPGQTLEVRFTRQGDKVSYEVEHAGVVVASGQLFVVIGVLGVIGAP